jgi:outer membrane protein
LSFLKIGAGLMRGGLLNAVGIAALLAGGGAAGAETLRGALVQTYQSNPTLNAERANVRTLDESVAIARAQGRPQLSGNVGLNQNVLTSNTVGGRTFSAGVDVAYPLFDGGRVRNSVRAANERVAGGRATLRATEGDVFTQAVGAYMDVIRDRTVVTLNENEVKVLETNLQATKDQFEVGDLTRTDVAQSEARLALARSNLAAAQGRLRGSEETYRQVIGSLPGDLDPPDPLPPLPTTPDQAVDIALANNPDLIAINAQARAAGLDVSVARAGRLPTVSAVTSASHLNFLGTANEQFGAPAGVNLPETQTTAAVGVTARIPIYQGGLVGAQVRQAQSVQSQLLEQGVGIERQVVANVRAAFASYQAAEQSIAANQVAVSANTLALEGARAEQSVGTRTVLDVLNAEQELLNSQVALVTARHDAYVAGFSLLNAMGEAESRSLNLDGGALYDPVANYRRVARNANDWAQDATPHAVSTRTAPPGVPAPGERPETDVTAPPR